MATKKTKRPSSSGKNEPKVMSEVLEEFFQSNEPLAAALRARLFKDLHPHTELGVDLKLLTHKPGRMPVDANLNGCITRDGELHYTFTEMRSGGMGKRNPHVYVGEYITITRRDDGSLRPNFKPMPKLRANLSVDNYAFEVYRELRGALKGLVEE